MAVIRLLLCVVSVVCCVLAESDYEYPEETFPRNVVATLNINNGLNKGSWRRSEFCSSGTYATGVELRVQSPSILDDSGMNAMQLQCRPYDLTDDLYYSVVDSHFGLWGSWRGILECQDDSSEERSFLTQFQLRIEAYNAIFGNSAVNNANFQCRDLNTEGSYQLEGNGNNKGKWSDWSESCPLGSAICGVSTRFYEPDYIDELAITDVMLYCCDD